MNNDFKEKMRVMYLVKELQRCFAIFKVAFPITSPS